ncbi:MAG: glycosyltransferase [Xanthomonadaceae bacterium]|nr:glycosyltransferase [Xanthomonadaceae bacterium]
MPRLSDIAVIIPAGPGEREWVPLLPQLHEVGERVLSCVHGDVPPLPETTGVRVVEGEPGRARQLNAGAAATARPWLWFIHADSRVVPATLDAVATAPDRDMLGYCDLRFYDGPPWMAVNAFFGNLRSRWFGLPFGDQGLLMPRAVYNQLGGFDETLAAAEDHALVWAARHARIPVTRLRAPLYTSGRRYADEGWFRVTARHATATILQARLFSARHA